MLPLSRLCLLALLLCLSTALRGQDVEAVYNAPWLTGGGGIAASMVSNFAPGDSLARQKDPYAYFLSGNLNLNIKGVVDFPLAFAYTTGQASSQASLPFNRFSIAPSYKWVKVYGGFASLSLSPYSLAGHEIFGGGVELTPQNGWYAAAIYGRLQKAAQPYVEGSDPAYQRMGGGFKLAYTHRSFLVGVTLFKATDQLGSIRFAPGDSARINPKDNLSGSLNMGLQLAAGLQFNAEYGFSALNQNIAFADSLGLEGSRWINTHGDFALFHAFKGNLSQSTPIGTLGATYERVNPNYTTLGAYFMVNDFENITANYSGDILGRVNLGLDVGYQRDNLAKLKDNTNNRLLTAANVSAAVTKRLNLGLNLSNMQSYVYIADPQQQLTQTNEYEMLDTLNFTQINFNGSVNGSYQLVATKEQRQSVSGSAALQRAADNQPGKGGFEGNNMYNAMFMYQFALVPQKFNTSLSVNYNHNQMQDTSYMAIVSTSLTVQKTLWEEVKAMFNCTHSRSLNQEGPLGDIVNLRITGSYTLKKKHNFNLSAAMIHNQGSLRTSTQYALNLGYSYAFSFVVQRQERKWKATGEF